MESVATSLRSRHGHFMLHNRLAMCESRCIRRSMVMVDVRFDRVACLARSALDTPHLPTINPHSLSHSPSSIAIHLPHNYRNATQKGRHRSSSPLSLIRCRRTRNKSISRSSERRTRTAGFGTAASSDAGFGRVGFTKDGGDQVGEGGGE